MASVRLLRRAEADLEAAIAWYEARSEQAARRFEAALTAALDRLADFPEMYAPDDGVHRLCPIARFLYLVVYRFDSAANEVIIVAVAHASQGPPPWLTPA